MGGVLSLDIPVPVILPFAASLIVALLLLAVLRPSSFSARYARHLSSVQSTHVRPTLRIGGVAIMAGFAVLWSTMAPEPDLVVGLSILPVAVVGLLEDLHVPMSPRRRLLSVALAALVEIALRGAWMTRYDLAGFDVLVAHAAFGIPVTVLLVAGLSHAFNLIDGLHGLASGVAALAACALGVLSVQAGDAALALACFGVAAVIAGFLLVNYPFGLMFLGDAGAYSVGYILAWLGIALVLRNPEVSAWSVFLIFLWPIAETFWAILRRKFNGLPATCADRMHMHHIVLRGIEIAAFGKQRRRVTNPLATAVILPLAGMPMLTGIWLWRDAGDALAAALGFLALYVASYLLAVRLMPRLRRVSRPRKVAFQ